MAAAAEAREAAHARAHRDARVVFHDEHGKGHARREHLHALSVVGLAVCCSASAGEIAQRFPLHERVGHDSVYLEAEISEAEVALFYLHGNTPRPTLYPNLVHELLSQLVQHASWGVILAPLAVIHPRDNVALCLNWTRRRR